LHTFGAAFDAAFGVTFGPAFGNAEPFHTGDIGHLVFLP
jgi:hypothetical protein